MLTLLIGLVAALILVSAALFSWLDGRARPHLIQSLENAPRDALIVVLGCPPRRRSGEPNGFFVGRVAAAAAAYHHNPHLRILCSGSIGRDEADEANGHALALVSAAVPRSSILLDQGSARTIDSIDFLAAHHRESEILLVTQRFHLPRALFLAHMRGVNAWGLVARGPRLGWRGRLRERVAQLRALIDILLKHPGK